ncbi:LOW QUALITY PROTEIN: uncharacterized protein [Atheta coriaria]|uniref:LOW QUALITY PROTEIN: uncharacterized protein n=1 Tax=Dalotia coriaria TaxID=877792 RepID=UPI0031F3B761
MEGTDALLMRVLKIHFEDRLHILYGALQAIKEYSNKDMSTHSEYDEITATLKGMLNDLPEDILKYFLTFVPPPKCKENLSLNVYDAEDIRSVLMNYVNRDVSSAPSKIVLSKDVETSTVEKKTRSLKKLPVKRRSGRSKKTPQECKKLLDICAEYIVKNHTEMYNEYQSQKEEVWRLLEESNRFSAEELNALYVIGRDLNKKLKWLRLLEAEEITDEIILDSYYDEDILTKESELLPLLTEDPFVVSKELEASIMKFVSA